MTSSSQDAKLLLVYYTVLNKTPMLDTPLECLAQPAGHVILRKGYLLGGEPFAKALDSQPSTNTPTTPTPYVALTLVCLMP